MAERQALPATPQTPAPRSSSGGHGLRRYKPEQGYWTRVGTAIGLGLLLVSGIAWAVRQCELVNIPTVNWTVTLDSTDAIVAQGSDVKFTAEPTDPATPAPEVGSAKVVESSKGSTGRVRLVVDSFAPGASGKSLREAKFLTSSAGAAPTPTSAAPTKVISVESNPLFSLLWLQGATALALLVLGGGLIYWFVGVRIRTVDFLIATDAEMKKVNWSTRKTILDSTKMVVLACVLIATSIYIIDLVFRWFFDLIGVIDA